MITRVCISINNVCNLRCKYCHFHEKQSCIEKAPMDVFKILDNIKDHIKKYGLGIMGEEKKFFRIIGEKG